MSLITITQTVQQPVSAIQCDAVGCTLTSTNQQDPAWAHIAIPLGASWAGNQKPQRDYCTLAHLVASLQTMHTQGLPDQEAAGGVESVGVDEQGFPDEQAQDG